MELTNQDILVSLKKLCRRLSMCHSEEKMLKATALEKEMLKRFENNQEQLDNFNEYVGLAFNPPSVMTTSDEELDTYYSKVLELERKLSL